MADQMPPRNSVLAPVPELQLLVGRVSFGANVPWADVLRSASSHWAREFDDDGGQEGAFDDSLFQALGDAVVSVSEQGAVGDGLRAAGAESPFVLFEAFDVCVHSSIA